jgi:translation initiation factor 2 subunit 1
MELAFGEDLDDETYAAIANELLAEFGSMYDGFESAAIHGKDALEDVDLDEEEIDAIVQTARNNVSVPYVQVTGYVDLSCPESDGVDVIKEALQAAEGNGEVPKEIELEVTYVGSPEYRIQVQAPDYKTAEDALEESAARAAKVVEQHGGTGQFHRERSEDDE